MIDRFRGSRPPEAMEKYKDVQIKIVDPEGNILYDGPLAGPPLPTSENISSFLSDVDKLSPELATRIINNVETMSTDDVVTFLSKVDNLSPESVSLLLSKTSSLDPDNVIAILSKMDDRLLEQVSELLSKMEKLTPEETDKFLKEVRGVLGVPEEGKPNSLLTKIRDWAYGYDLDPENYASWTIKVGEGGQVIGRDGEVLSDGWYMYVLDRDNNLRYLPTDPTLTSNKPFEQYRAHTQLAGGENVWGAGTLYIEGGKFKLIDTGSGHYKPSSEYLDYTETLLAHQKFDIGSTEFRAFKSRLPWYHPKEMQRLFNDVIGTIDVGTRRLFGQQMQEKRPKIPPELEDIMPY